MCWTEYQFHCIICCSSRLIPSFYSTLSASNSSSFHYPPSYLSSILRLCPSSVLISVSCFFPHIPPQAPPVPQYSAPQGGGSGMLPPPPTGQMQQMSLGPRPVGQPTAVNQQMVGPPTQIRATPPTQSGSQPTQIGGAPPTQVGGPPTQFGSAPPTQVGGPPTQFGGAARNQFGGQPTQVGATPPTQFGATPPTQFGVTPSMQFRGPPTNFGTGPPPTQMGGPPTSGLQPPPTGTSSVASQQGQSQCRGGSSKSRMGPAALYSVDVVNDL